MLDVVNNNRLFAPSWHEDLDRLIVIAVGALIQTPDALSTHFPPINMSGFLSAAARVCLTAFMTASIAPHSLRANSAGRPVCGQVRPPHQRSGIACLWILRNMFVCPSGRAMRLGRIDLVSKRGRGRSREQATTTTTAAGEPLAGLTFFVKDMECRQADIGNFILAERNFLTHCGVARRRIWSRPGCCGHSARHRQRQSGRSQNRYGFATVRGSLHARHLNSPGQERPFDSKGNASAR